MGEFIQVNARDTAGDKYGVDLIVEDGDDVNYPRIKLIIGADGVNDGDVHTGNPLPITGTVTANLGTIAGVATETTLAAQSAKLPLTLGQKAAAASMSVVLASDQGAVPISATSLPLPSGAATAANQLADGHNVTVSGTVTATGPLTDTELRATPVPVSGTVTASGPLTDTELRATPVPVSGTVTANIGTSGALALDATLTDRSQFAKITDGAVNLALATVGAVNTIPVTLFDGSGSLIGAGGTIAVQDDGPTLTGVKNAVELIDDAVVANGSGSTPTKALAIAGYDGTNPRYIKTDTDGHLQTDILKIGSVEDAGNSTDTPLGISGVFTGTGVDLLGYSAVCITLTSSHDSVVDGMTFQFSTDGTNWDDVYPFTMDVSASDTRRFQFAVTARYFRIVYTNGGTAQSAFRVATILHTQNQLTSIHRLSDDVSPDRSAQLVIATLMAQESGTGDFKRLASTVNGWLKVEVKNADGTDGAKIQGNEPHDDADVGHPIKIGGKASTALPTAVAHADRVNAYFDPTGHQHIKVDAVGSVVDAGNSTVTPLGGGATFTGTSIDVQGYTNVVVNVTADVDSATDGIKLQFSPDNTNWASSEEFTFDQSAVPDRMFQSGVMGQYFRVVFVNGAGAQGTFRLQSVLHTGTPITTIHRLGEDEDPDRSCTLSKSIIIAQAAGSGDFKPVQATGGGNLKTALEEIDAGVLGQDTMANSLPVTMASNQTAIGVTLQTDAIRNGTTALPPKFAKIDENTAATNELIAFVSSKKLRVLAGFINAHGDQTVRFQDDTGTPVELTGDLDLTTNSGFVLPFNPVGWFETSSGKALDLVMSDAVQVGGCLVYVEV